LLHHPSKGGLQSSELLGGVLFLDNYYIITLFTEDSDRLSSRFFTLDLLHLVIFYGSSGHYLGAWWSDGGSDHDL